VTWIVLTCLATAPTLAHEWEFVRAQGDQLVVGDSPFRFVSLNIPNLHLVEDNYFATAATPWAWPTDFEIRDSLESIRQLGGNVVRTYVLSVHREGSDMGEHVYVQGPGQFNEQAFEVLDRVLAVARDKRIRLIIPLVDNWTWWGGRAEYAAFRGKPADAFWTDPQLIADFEQTIKYVTHRVNKRTGIAYRDDPTILGWETGNELDSPPEWTRRIAATLKQAAPRQLIIDGNALHGIHRASLDDPHIDMVTTHHYPNVGGDFVGEILRAREQTRGKKPYFVGEFGFVSPEEVERVLEAVTSSGTAGALLWSLRCHHREGGFYWHSEPAGGGVHKAYHWPGFATGEAYRERRILELARRYASKIQGRPLTPLRPPHAPSLLPVTDVGAISWQGSAGATHYDVQRAGSPGGPWTTVGHAIDDSHVQYAPLFADSTATPGVGYFYRVLAYNQAGASEPSESSDAVVPLTRVLVDECRDLSQLDSHRGRVEAVSNEPRQRREDMHRLLLHSDSAIVYHLPGAIDTCRLVIYRGDPTAELKLMLSDDGQQYRAATIDEQRDVAAANDYGYLERAVIGCRARQGTSCWLKIEAAQPIEVGRVEIRCQ
jgi:hypothetical protein